MLRADVNEEGSNLKVSGVLGRSHVKSSNRKELQGKHEDLFWDGRYDEKTKTTCVGVTAVAEKLPQVWPF